LLILTTPAHAWDLYAQAGLAADLQPQRYATWECQKYCQHVEKKLFVPGAMDHIALGLESGPVQVSIHHLSAIGDGVKGRGLTWFEAGVKVKLMGGGR
jgi:hypothetical protein